jgi:uncharacterized protein YcfL
MKKILLSVFVFIIVGCASNGDKQTAKGDGYRCDKYVPTGSAIPKRICTTKAQRKIMEENAKDVLKKARDNTVTDVTY